MSIKVTYIEPNGTRREVVGSEGQNLMKLAVANGLDIEGACGGAMACATCHVIVDEAWAGRLAAPVADELDMLELAPNLTKTSRLGCQISLTSALDGLVVYLPRE